MPTFTSIRAHPPALDVLEEAERKGMSWLVDSTARLLDCDLDNLSNSRKWLNREEIVQVKSVMRAWALRSSRRRNRMDGRGNTDEEQKGLFQPSHLTQTSSYDKENSSPHVVERILSRLKAEEQGGNQNVRVMVEHYNILIEAWARSRSAESAQRAENVLNEMIRDSPNPNSRSFNTVMKAYVRVGDEESMDRAKRLLRRAEGLDLASLRIYNLYLSGLQRRRACPEDSEAVLKRMKENGICPDTNSYNQVLRSWASKGGTDRAHHLLEEMAAPNVDSFNAILNCWNRSGSSSALINVKKVVSMIDVMCRSENASMKPNLTTINTALTVYAKEGTPTSAKLAEDLFAKAENDYGIQLDTLTFNLIINIHSKAQTSSSAEKNIKLLDMMESRFRANFGSSQNTAMPDSLTYTSVIDSISKSSLSNRGLQADEIYQRMDSFHRNYGGMRPTTEVMNAILNAYAMSKEKKAVKRAEQILQDMQERFESGEKLIKPNRRTYNTCLKVYSLRGLGDKAECLLEEMERAFINGHLDLSPDCRSYTTAISAYARGNSPGKAANALKILNRMCESFNAGNKLSKPAVEAFNSCLNASAYSNLREENIEAFLVAVSAFLMLGRNGVAPDSTTYATFLKACSKVIPKGDDREQVVEVIFRRCCRDGLVNDFVRSQLRFAATSSSHFQSMLREETYFNRNDRAQQLT